MDEPSALDLENTSRGPGFRSPRFQIRLQVAEMAEDKKFRFFVTGVFNDAQISAGQ
jgi:hypothetical protein